jgi:hypothetical protein
MTEVLKWDVVDGGILGAVIRCPHCPCSPGFGCDGDGQLHREYRLPGGAKIDLHIRRTTGGRVKVTITQAEADAGLAVFTVPAEDTSDTVELVTEEWVETILGPVTERDPVPGVWTVKWVPAENAVRADVVDEEAATDCVTVSVGGVSAAMVHPAVYDRLDLTPGRMVGIARREKL